VGAWENSTANSVKETGALYWGAIRLGGLERNYSWKKSKNEIEWLGNKNGTQTWGVINFRQARESDETEEIEE